MTEIEKMKRYISNTQMGQERNYAYTMNFKEMIALSRMADTSAIDAICIAFEYGKAKGARCARKQMAG